MDASARVTGLVDELITLFNRHSEDLPDGLFDRRTQFLLNGVPYEEMVGRSPSDPLVLMLTRGPAGYRFALKAILHAVPDARLERGEFASTTRSTQPVLACQCWLSGHFRGRDDVRRRACGGSERSDRTSRGEHRRNGPRADSRSKAARLTAGSVICGSGRTRTSGECETPWRVGYGLGRKASSD
jgi:hypothetical protein